VPSPWLPYLSASGSLDRFSASKPPWPVILRGRNIAELEDLWRRPSRNPALRAVLRPLRDQALRSLPPPAGHAGPVIAPRCFLAVSAAHRATAGPGGAARRWRRPQGLLAAASQDAGLGGPPRHPVLPLGACSWPPPTAPPRRRAPNRRNARPAARRSAGRSRQIKTPAPTRVGGCSRF